MGPRPDTHRRDIPPHLDLLQRASRRRLHATGTKGCCRRLGSAHFACTDGVLQAEPVWVETMAYPRRARHHLAPPSAFGRCLRWSRAAACRGSGSGSWTTHSFRSVTGKSRPPPANAGCRRTCRSSSTPTPTSSSPRLASAGAGQQGRCPRLAGVGPAREGGRDNRDHGRRLPGHRTDRPAQKGQLPPPARTGKRQRRTPAPQGPRRRHLRPHEESEAPPRTVDKRATASTMPSRPSPPCITSPCHGETAGQRLLSPTRTKPSATPFRAATGPPGRRRCRGPGPRGSSGGGLSPGSCRRSSRPAGSTRHARGRRSVRRAGGSSGGCRSGTA